MTRAALVLAAALCAALALTPDVVAGGGGSKAGVGADTARGVKSKLARLRQRVQRRGPAYLAEGTMSRAYVSGDGTSVFKRVKPVLHGVQRVTPEARVELARRQVEGMDILREAGFPVPPARVAASYPGTIVQERVVTGRTMKQLTPRARRAALRNMITATFRAWRVLWPRGFRGWVDAAPDNIRFDDRGGIVSWFDPIYPISLGRVIWMSQVRKRVYARMGWGPERSTPWDADHL